jgi:hypothetical protein
MALTDDSAMSALGFVAGAHDRCCAGFRPPG